MVRLVDKVEAEFENIEQVLIEYLAFRHFFSYSYALDLYPTKMEPLVEKISNTYYNLKTEINQKLNNLNK